jgi:hypothetical protein
MKVPVNFNLRIKVKELCMLHAVLLLACSVVTQTSVSQYLQDISVTVLANGASGSGVIVTREFDGHHVSFVLTAAHVILRNRVEETVTTASGAKRTVVRYSEVQIVRELVESGRKVGEVRMSARVVRVSPNEDIAVLQLNKTDYTEASAKFYLDEKIPELGTRLFHVGSLLGQIGSNSMTSGIMSQIGRIITENGQTLEYDQTTVTAFPGSSGGGVFLEDGRYIGMIVRGAGEGFNLIIPIRRIVRWAKTNNLMWLLDHSLPTPELKSVTSGPVEDSGPAGKATTDDDEMECYPYLIQVLPLVGRADYGTSSLRTATRRAGEAASLAP